MPDFLTLALVAPIASFGDVTVGERRSGWNRPARSAVLGLIGACLGVERADADGQAALAEGYGVALLAHAPGDLLADYHTTQVPPTKRNRTFATRAEELAAPDLATILSRRDYRVGAWHLAAIWGRATPRWTLAELEAAMLAPHFAPYLGRKACPLGLPLAPRIVTHDSPEAALLERQRSGPEATLAAPGTRSLRHRLAGTPERVLVVLDDTDVAPDHPHRRRTEFRRDQPRSRARWQFDLRAEAVLEFPQP